MTVDTKRASACLRIEEQPLPSWGERLASSRRAFDIECGSHGTHDRAENLLAALLLPADPSFITCCHTSLPKPDVKDFRRAIDATLQDGSSPRRLDTPRHDNIECIVYKVVRPVTVFFMQHAAPPLAGRRVIELGTMLAAPFAAHILSQLGAEVIKVEPPAGDPTRCLVRGGPSGTFIAYSHGKKSVCIDLSKPEGHAALCKLLHTADALVHNLSPKAARKLRLTRQDCEAVNPRLIYCQIRGYGAGPLEDDLASNPVAEASTGVMEANRVDGRPSRLGPSYHDQFAGAYAVIGILASMLQSREDKQAGPVEVGLYETGLHVASRDLVGVQLKTQLLGRPEREPHGEFSMPGYGAYQTSDECWIYLLMLNDTHWLKFCRAMDVPNDDSLSTLRQRKKARERVESLVKAAVAAHSFDSRLRNDW
jgi:crotonobetainyl-CoA:carnitine CoA-transferase CaiB-like acyl-CoA transferase